MHPARTVRRAVTPRPIKQARRAVFVATNPLAALEVRSRTPVVDSLRSGGGRKRSRAGTGGAESHGDSSGSRDHDAAAAEGRVVCGSS